MQFLCVHFPESIPLIGDKTNQPRANEYAISLCSSPRISTSFVPLIEEKTDESERMVGNSCMTTENHGNYSNEIVWCAVKLCGPSNLAVSNPYKGLQTQLVLTYN